MGSLDTIIIGLFLGLLVAAILVVLVEYFS